MKEESLDGIRLKLKRGWSQIDELRSDIKAFLDLRPYEPKVDFNPSTQLLTVRVMESKPPDQMWGVRVGEIAHNFRSALDHLIWELAKRPEPAEARTQFPISDSSKAFDSSTTHQLKNVPATAVSLIRSQQPFPDGGTGLGRNDPLAHLRELSNIDKHRTLHVAVTTLQSHVFKFPRVKFDFQSQVVQQFQGGPIGRDTILYQARLSATEWPFETTEIDASIQTDVCFERDVPAPGSWVVIGTLVDIANKTQRLIAEIATVFGLEL